MALPASSSGPQHLADIFAQARTLVQREQTIELDGPRVWDEIRSELDRVGLRGDYPEPYFMIRDAFMKEACPTDMHALETESYGGLTARKQLYEMRWQSARCKREMYLKFALFDGRFVLMKFHESTRESGKVIGIKTKRSMR